MNYPRMYFKNLHCDKISSKSSSYLFFVRVCGFNQIFLRHCGVQWNNSIWCWFIDLIHLPVIIHLMVIYDLLIRQARECLSINSQKEVVLNGVNCGVSGAKVLVILLLLSHVSTAAFLLSRLNDKVWTKQSDLWRALLHTYSGLQTPGLKSHLNPLNVTSPS